jgi:hypothetical protein
MASLLLPETMLGFAWQWDDLQTIGILFPSPVLFLEHALLHSLVIKVILALEVEFSLSTSRRLVRTC